MNAQLFLTLGLLGILLQSTGCAGLSGFARRTGPAYEAEVQSWQQVIQEKGGNGMWLVNRGYRLGDDIVATATGSAFPHSAILDHKNGVVIEALWPGNVVTPLEEFLALSHRIALVQPKGWTPEAGDAALAKARSQLGKKYDFGGILGLPGSNRWYCSELAAWCWDRPADRLGPWHVIHPRRLLKMGTVVFDSGSRDGVPDAPSAAAPALPAESAPAPAPPCYIPPATDCGR